MGKIAELDGAGADRRSAAEARVRPFVRRHFSPAGSIRLHRHALGADLLRAPLNVALAPVFLLVRLTAVILSLCGLKRIASRIAGARILFRTGMARNIERLVAEELLRDPDPDARTRRLLEDYTGTRSAVSEITTTLIVLFSGALLFHTATPGLASLAPKVSNMLAHSNAVTSFPLGQTLGSVWYSVFPVGIPIWFIVATGFVLAMIASLVTTFAGIVADPIQAALGTHRRRLTRLVRRVHAADAGAAGIEKEHLVARIGDLTDVSLSIIRMFKP